ncbi:MAG TPA: glutamate racemase [Woeseiaceae bacterium]|nr:glutamate racemase [Woeseiaceae bacterium]
MAGNLKHNKPIGIFDSGVGGLTVLKALRARLPDEHFVYLGDTARLPYGIKSPASILRYARQAAAHLGSRDIKLLVIACNTASAVALKDLQAELAPLPVIGVIEPGASAAVRARPAASHLVLATEATVRLAAYSEAIQRLDRKATVRELACELLVALAEEGWTSGGIADAVIRRYLEPYLAGDKGAELSSIILGCTHFPLLRDALSGVTGDQVSIVDSAGTTANVVADRLQSEALTRSLPGDSRLQLLATDGARRFARVGGSFLGTELSAEDIEIVDL